MNSRICPNSERPWIVIVIPTHPGSGETANLNCARANKFHSYETSMITGEVSLSDLDLAVRDLAAAPTDRRSWQRFFDLIWPYLLSIADRHLTTPHGIIDSEDLAQEVLLKFSNALHAKKIVLTDEYKCRALLALTTRRLALDRIRYRHRKSRDERKNISLEKSGDPVSTNDAIAIVEWFDLIDAVQSELGNPEMRILDLRLQGYRLIEIAEKLGISEKTVQRKLISIRKIVQSAIPGPV